MGRHPRKMDRSRKIRPSAVRRDARVRIANRARVVFTPADPIACKTSRTIRMRVARRAAARRACLRSTRARSARPTVSVISCAIRRSTKTTPDARARWVSSRVRTDVISVAKTPTVRSTCSATAARVVDASPVGATATRTWATVARRTSTRAATADRAVTRAAARSAAAVSSAWAASPAKPTATLSVASARKPTDFALHSSQQCPSDSRS